MPSHPDDKQIPSAGLDPAVHVFQTSTRSEHELERMIVEFVAEWSHRNVSEISADTLINSGKRGGLAVDGADADELIEFISNRVGWLLKNFNYNDYFGPEVGWNPISVVVMLVKGDWKRLPPLTIGELSQKFFECQPAGD